MDIFHSRKKRFISAVIITSFCCILMLIFPATTIWSARKGISLWLGDIVPALLPFFICANFLQNIGVISLLKTGVFPFVMSGLSGYPMGAKIIGDLRRKDEISEIEAKRLMSFCNTSGPAFMVGAVGAGMLKSPEIGGIIAVAHYAGALINGMVYSRIYPKSNSNLHICKTQEQREIHDAFTEAIFMSLKALGVILSYIVIFMFITDLLNLSGVLLVFERAELRALIKGLMEMTVGCGAVAELSGCSEMVKCIMCSFIISWGGLSVIGQMTSMLVGTRFPISFIIISKLSHGIFSAVVAFAICIFML